MNKFLVTIFCGLLCLAVSPSYAADSSMNEIKRQSAEEFLTERTSFKGGDLKKDTIVLCGEVTCDLENNVCLKKEKTAWGASFWQTIVNFKNTGVTDIKYICVDQFEISKYTADGWVSVDEKENNVTRRVQTNGKEAKEERKECYQATSPQGVATQYCIRRISDQVTVYSAKNEGARICEVVPVSWYNSKKCHFCSLIGVIYKVSDEITFTSATKFASSFAIVIAFGMGLWVAMKTLVFVSSMAKQDAAKYITEIVKQGYKFMIAFFLLLYYHNIFGYIINPLLNSGLIFGDEFVHVVSWEDRIKEENEDYNNESLQTLCATNKDILSLDYQRNCDNTFYSVEMYKQIENFAYNVNQQYALLQTIGSSLLCLGGKYLLLQITDQGWQIGLGIDCIIYGIFFWVFGFLLCLGFIFYLLDAVVQLGIVGALLPFLVASWPFKITSKYTATGFKMLLNSIFTFMMMGIIVRISMELISVSMAFNISGDEEQQGGSGLLVLVEAIDKVDTNSLKELVNVFSLGFLMFMFANILGFLLLARITELVDRFASGGMQPSAPSIATMGASAVKGAALKVAQPTTDAIGEWADDKARNATRWAVDGAVGLATLRPVRNWINKKAASGGGSGGSGGGSDGSGSGAGGSDGSSGGGSSGSSGSSGGSNPTPERSTASIGNGSSGETRQTTAKNPQPQTQRQENKETSAQGQSNRTEQDANGRQETPAPDAVQPDTDKNDAAAPDDTPDQKQDFVRGGKPTTIGNGRRPDRQKLDELD